MFNGEERDRKKISLGGRRSRDVGKEEVMRRARLERQERAEAKRKKSAATNVSAWWRGRWLAWKARKEVGSVWDGQMRDLGAIRAVFREKGSEFKAPAKTVNALVRSYLFAFGRRPKVDSDRLEVLCDWLLADAAAAREGLTYDQCRGVLLACLKTARQQALGASQKRLLLASVTEATQDHAVSPFLYLADAIAAICPHACTLARQEDDDLWLKVAAAGVIAAANITRSDLAKLARRAYGNHGLPLQMLPGSELGPVCSAMLEPRLEVPCSEMALLAIAQAVVETDHYEPNEDIASVCAELVAGLSRGALLDTDDEYATRNSTMGRGKNGATLITADTSDESSDDDDEEERVKARRKNGTETTRTLLSGRRSLFLLDSRVFTEIAERERQLKPRVRPQTVKSTALAHPRLWERLLCHGNSPAGVRMAALVLAVCAPAPRVRATSPPAPPIVNAVLDALKSQQTLGDLWQRAAFFDEANKLTDRGAAFVVFCSSASRRLLRLDNAALRSEALLPLSQLLEVAEALRDSLRSEIWVKGTLHDQRRAGFWTFYMVSLGARLFNQLHDRLGGSALRLTQPSFWLWPNVHLSERLADDSGHSASNDNSPIVIDNDGDATMSDAAINGVSGTQDSVALSKEPRVALVLAAMPFVVSFEQRLALFNALLEIDRVRFQEDEVVQFRPLARRSVRIRRERVFEDGFAALGSGSIKNKIYVTFVNAAGEDEAGIDGGGLFKEFLDEVAKLAFGPQRFASSTSNALYPLPDGSPHDSWTLDDDTYDLMVPSHLSQIEFCGRIIGKALYERVLVEPRFARFFLNKCLGKDNYFDDLESLDYELYRNLLKLQKLSADELPNLGLTMAVTVQESTGCQRDVELVPRGSHILVDDRNRETYAQLVAHHRLNVQTAASSAAFLRGLRDAIPLRWLRMFDPDELQLLISGDDKPIDIEDWQNNTHYGGGYHSSQPYIQQFWNIVKDFDAENRAKLLRFITSCSRPPLLGFASLRPLICIHKVPDGSRFPTSGTCMNLLKLPIYEDAAILRKNLLYAINEAQGFELS